jgi:hypothetical protein
MPLTVEATRNELLSKLGVLTPATPPTQALQDVATAMNWAFQMLWRGGPDYFTREDISVTLVSGQREYVFDRDTQAILGPVLTATGKTLRRLLSRGEVEDFGLIYLGQASRTVSNGAPQCYFIENRRTAPSTDGDIHQMSIFVCPAPDAAAVTAHSPLLVEGVPECPAYTVANLTDPVASAPLPVADQYAESIFLPLARLQLTRSYLFSQTENLPRIQEDAATAMRILGIAAPDAVLAKEGDRE